MSYFEAYLLFIYRRTRFAITAPPLYAKCGIQIAWLYAQQTWGHAKVAWCDLQLALLERRLAKAMSKLTPEERAQMVSENTAT